MMKGRKGGVIGLLAAAAAAVVFFGAGARVLANCAGYGLPFTDLGSETTFCAAIAEAYFAGLTNGTSATTFSPSDKVPRDQMTAFIGRTLDAGLSRGNRRTKLQQFWNGAPRWDLGFGLTTVGSAPQLLQSDGGDVWVPDFSDGTVYRVRASDGSVEGHWTGASEPFGVLVALGRVFVTGETSPGKIYMIDPSAAPGAATNVTSTVGNQPLGIAFDGTHIWTANLSGSVSIITPQSGTTWPTTTVSTGFLTPQAAIFDGSNIWIADAGDGTMKKVDASGGILQTVSVGSSFPNWPAFDGTNLWVPTYADNSVRVIRASTGAVLATLTGNGLDHPVEAAFDGRRIVVTNAAGGLSLFQATSFAPLGTYSTSGMTEPWGACSDGSSFWISDRGGSSIGRF